MQIFQLTLIDDQGRPVSGAAVSIYVGGTSTLAACYKADGVTGVTNPLTTNPDGYAECHLLNGEYDVVAVKNEQELASYQHSVAYDPDDDGGVGIFSDANFTIHNDADNTKEGMFDASGITTETTRTYVLPNANGTLALLSDLSSFISLARAKSPPAISNNVSDANNDIDIAAGTCTADDGTVLTLASGITKRLDAAWAAGTNNGGLFSGSKASNTWYAVFLISNGTTVDVGFDTSSTGANAPVGYTSKRRIGWVRTDGSSNIRAFKQSGDSFLLATPVLDVSVTNLGTTTTAYTLASIPPNCRAKVRYFTSNTTASYILIQPTFETTAAISGSASPLATARGQVNSQPFAGEIDVDVDTSSQIKAVSTAASTTLMILSKSWVDMRGRDS